MSALATRLRSLRRYLSIMQSPRDLFVYARMRAMRSPESRRLHTLHVRSLGGAPVRCRDSTADVFTFKAVFVHEFHLPPMALGRRAVILDLGSNIGLTVAHLAHTYPTARVIGVEMDADNLALALHNTARFGERVRMLHAAVWTRDGTVAYRGDRSDGFQVSGDAAAADDRTVTAMRIETIMDQCDVAVADYVKMDVEGAEAELLSADAAWLDRVRAIKVEVHPPATMDSVSAVLRARGFRCWPDPHHRQCVCAVRSELTEDLPSAHAGDAAHDA